MTHTARLILSGQRLHLQHGPIDLIIGADGQAGTREAAFAAAEARFASVLGELVAELPMLRRPMCRDAELPVGEVARRMDRATRPHCDRFITRMAAVAGAVADTVLAAMCAAAPLDRAYVNNGGDIAVHLAPGQRFSLAMCGHDGPELGRAAFGHGSGIGGVATSGRHGRSHSLGIADSVTVLARTAAEADAAATLIANAVDLPGHPAICRRRACDLDPDSDLGRLPVVTACGPLGPADISAALDRGQTRAETLRSAGHFSAAALFLCGHSRVLGENLVQTNRELTDA